MLMKSHLLFVILLFVKFWYDVEASIKNNVCESFTDYLSYPMNRNCWFDPDMELEAPGLLNKYLDMYEPYSVTTEDGYILTMFRMPRKNRKGVILLQHPVTVDCRIFIGEGNKSLGFFLWNAGYEVWLNNQRGTPFSQKHEKLAFTSFQFWNFSFHEVGLYDIPAQINKIREVTNNSKVIFIGQSFGATAGLVYATMRAQEVKDSVKIFVLMGTPVYFKHITPFLQLFIPYKSFFEVLVDVLHFGNFTLFLPLRTIFKMLTRIFPITLVIVNVLFCAFTGWTLAETDPTILNLDFGIYLKAFSTKILLHYLQLIKSGNKFQMYDYGKKQNLKYYHSEIPPAYPLMNLSVPILFMSSSDDTLTTLKDTDLLIQDLPKNVKYEHWKLSHLNHMQYFLSKHEYYFERVLKFLNGI